MTTTLQKIGLFKLSARALLYGEFTVDIDGNPPTELIREDSATHTSIYFTYELLDTRTVQIVGTEVIPEFSSFLILQLLIITTLLAVTIYRRKIIL